MLRAALTGNVASGKSTVGEILAEWGATIIDADRIVRELQAPGSPVLKEIANTFGQAMITTTGGLDRDSLRRAILNDDLARRKLNAIMHPAVHRRRLELESKARDAGSRIVVHDIPLLFEVMDPTEFPVVILVDADPTVRKDRLLTRGLGTLEAEALMATQMDSSEKRRGATHVIENNGSMQDLRARVGEVWNEVLEEARSQLDSG